MDKHFENTYCKGNIKQLNDVDIIIEGTMNETIENNTIFFTAPSPPDMMTSFSGSGLPYVTKEQAFYNTPNKGIVKLNKKNFVIKLFRPNSYYVDFNTLKRPHVEIYYNNSKKMIDIDLSFEKISYRSLQYPPLRKIQKEMFYARKMPIRSQEKILRDSEYNDINESPDFWGLKPPN